MSFDDRFRGVRNRETTNAYRPMKKQLIVLSSALLTIVSAASAQSAFTATAISNATIRSDGETSSPWFHNAQPPGEFGSYGISSFQLSSSNFGGPVTSISSVEISYMQANAGFTSDGAVEFYVTFDSTVSGGDYSGLAQGSTGIGINDTEFSDTPTMVGSGTFTETGDGNMDTYSLSFTGALETSLMNAINNGDAFSIILGSTGAVATYAGIESFDYAANGDAATGQEPSSKMTNLTVTAVPEPSTYAALLGLAGFGLVLWRRRRG